MHSLVPMRTFLFLVAVLMSQPVFSASSWIDIEKLPNVRVATQKEIAGFRKAYAKSSGGYNLEQDDVRVLVHEGNLTAAQSVVSGDIVIVKGDLKITGNYHDYMGNGIGVLFVDGTMEVDNLYSWGAIHIGKDLRAKGVVLTVYNDFTFEVGGRVSARAVIVSDKSSMFKVQGEVAQIGEQASADEHALALRVLRPELFTNTRHFDEFPYDSPLLDFDDEMGRKYISEGKSLLRDKPAAPALMGQLKQAVAEKTTTATLKTLIGEDALLAQVIAARPDKKAALFEPLFATNDPVVREWLTVAHPSRMLSKIQDSEMTEAVATQLVKNDLDDATVTRLARSARPAVRATLAQVKALDRKWVNQLANDGDEKVRYQIIHNHADRLDDSAIEKRLTDVPTVLGALVQAPLTAEQLNKVLPKLDKAGVDSLTTSLSAWRVGDAATKLSSAEIDDFALKLLADPRNTSNVSRDVAFLALSGKAQVANFDAQINNKKVSVDSIARSTHSVAVLNKIIAFSDHQKVNIPENISNNPRLTLAMQRLIFDRGMKANPKSEVRNNPSKTLEDLLGEEHVAPEIIGLALTEMLKSGRFLSPMSHYKAYSPEQIKRLSNHFRGSEDWALSLLLQPRIQADELLPSLARWYSDKDVQRELKRMAGLSGEALFRALASASSEDLREAAARNVATPVDVLTKLAKDSERDVAWVAQTNPKLPINLRVQFAIGLGGEEIKHFGFTKPELKSLIAKLPDGDRTRLIAEREIRKMDVAEREK